MEDILKQIEELENRPLDEQSAGELIILYEDLLLSHRLTKEGQIYFSIKYASLLNAFESYEEAYEALVHLDLTEINLQDRAYINSLLGSLSVKLDFVKNTEDYLRNGVEDYQELCAQDDIYIPMYVNSLINLINYYHQKKMHHEYEIYLDSLNAIDVGYLRPMQIHEIGFNNLIHTNHLLNVQKYEQVERSLEQSWRFLNLFENKKSRNYLLYLAIYHQQVTRLNTSLNRFGLAVDSAQAAINARLELYNMSPEDANGISNLADSYLVLATLQRNLNKNEELLESLKQSLFYLLKINDAASYALGPIYLTVAETCSHLDRYKEAVEFAHKALISFQNIVKEDNDEDTINYDIAVVYRILAVCHLGLKDYEKAKDYGQIALEYFSKIKATDERFHFLIGSCYLIIGETDYYLHEFDQSLTNLRAALNCYDQIYVDNIQYAPIYRLIAQNHLALKDLDRVYDNLLVLESLLEKSEIDQVEYLLEEKAKTYKLFSKYYLALQDYDKAIEFCLRSLSNAQELSMIDPHFRSFIANIYQELAYLYYQNNDPRYHEIEKLIEEYTA